MNIVNFDYEYLIIGEQNILYGQILIQFLKIKRIDTMQNFIQTLLQNINAMLVLNLVIMNEIGIIIFH